MTSTLPERLLAQQMQPLPPSGRRPAAHLAQMIADLDRAAGWLSVDLGIAFDVVVSGPVGTEALHIMDAEQGGQCGPVVSDPDTGWWYWLVPPGTADRWCHEFGVGVGARHRMPLPPRDLVRPPGPYWARPLGDDRLVPPSALRRMLHQLQPVPSPHRALAAHLDPDRRAAAAGRARPYAPAAINPYSEGYHR